MNIQKQHHHREHQTKRTTIESVTISVIDEMITKEKETNIEIFNVENVTNQNNDNDDDKFDDKLLSLETSTKDLSIITTLITEENQKTTSTNTNMKEISSSENEKNIDLSIITMDTSLYNSSTFIFNFTENSTPTPITEKYQKTTDMIETTSTHTNVPMISSSENEKNINLSIITMDTSLYNSSTFIFNFTENSTPISITEKYQKTTDMIETTSTDTNASGMEEVSSNEDERNITNISEYIVSTISTTVKNNIIDDYSTITDTIDSTSDSSFNNQTCISGECKNLASKILFYMNHTIDPCEDFYEYACGGFEINPQTVEFNLEDISYQRILRQMKKENVENVSLFTKYYDSCMQYEKINQKERIKLARKLLDKVGKFYTTKDLAEKHTNFTFLLATLLLHNSVLLFDIAPDLDEYSPKQFTLKIGPTTYSNPFEIEETNDPCYADQLEREKETVDLGKLYKEYKTCKKNDTTKFINSISEALTAFEIFNELNNSYDISQLISSTYINIDFNIVKGFFANFPSQDKIREAYLMKNYTRITIEELQNNFKIINWTQLIYFLTKQRVQEKVKVQVYFYNELAKGLKILEEFEKTDPMTLYNALLALYARNLYHELVLSKHVKNVDIKKYCLRVATNILIPEASKLYISSFSKDELIYINETIHSIFEKLKETLKLNIKNQKWVTQKDRVALITKINNLKIVLPDISYFNNNKSIYVRYQANKVNLSNNYLENSIILMQRYRKLIYAQVSTNPGDLEQIWTHYAKPYQSKGIAIYGLNLIVIPFGIIDWSMNYNEYNKFSFDYIKMAIIGNIIAHQIAHHFDANGIYYWNGTRNAKNSLLNDDKSKYNFNEYINYHRNDQNYMSMTLSFTGQNVNYEISQLTLNERLSEITGLRLAYDTLARLRSKKDYLPWLELDFNQLFYLTYAQMYCTKSPLTSSYISLYENEQLPNRIRIFVSASNNMLLGKAWNCPQGSRIMPNIPYIECKVFPYLCDTAE
ncbi:neprilysin-3-like isoform X2 [Apis dorsata]|uniref:neprilysin-3-like isoform X2 n=1 Tax=Apis dorsata TaxID=7462 RepID=UPI00129368F8|nr:neprilysin-3-like isoform X2 [Apis dorsata]